MLNQFRYDNEIMTLSQGHICDGRGLGQHRINNIRRNRRGLIHARLSNQKIHIRGAVSIAILLILFPN